jgi:hypothetical protein
MPTVVAHEKRRLPRIESQQSSKGTAVHGVCERKKKKKKKNLHKKKKKKKKTKGTYHWPCATSFCDPSSISRQHFRFLYNSEIRQTSLFSFFFFFFEKNNEPSIAGSDLDRLIVPDALRDMS